MFYVRRFPSSDSTLLPDGQPRDDSVHEGDHVEQPDEPQVKRQKTDEFIQQSLLRWEPDEFRDLLESGVGFEVRPEPHAADADLVQTTKNFVAKIDEVIRSWLIAPTQNQRRSIMVVALCVHSDLVWSASSELLVTRLLGALFGDILRAHPDAVYHYDHGSWKVIEQMPASVIRNMETALVGAQSIFLGLYKRGIEKDWDTVMNFLSANYIELLHTHSTMMDFRGGGGDGTSSWACEAGKAAHLISVRYTGIHRPRQLCDSYGLWFQQGRPEANGMIDFNDCTVSLTTETSEGRQPKTMIGQIEKSPQNNCYIHIPTSLSFHPADSDVLRLRTFLCTTFAGQSTARRMTLAMEAFPLWQGHAPENDCFCWQRRRRQKLPYQAARLNIRWRTHAPVS